MALIRCLFIFVGVLLTSFYLFPIGVSIANTKMIMAVIGVVILVFKEAFAKKRAINKNIVIVVLLAFSISFICWFAIEYNHTTDTTYVSYIISMLVWLFGAYALVWYLQRVHGSLSILQISCYLAAVGAMQGVLAIWFDKSPELVTFFLRVHLLNADEVKYAQEGERLFGLGCAYDPGGIRLASILVIMGCTLNTAVQKLHFMWKFLYIAAFLCITVVGNMISRTTSVGLIIALIYVFIASGIFTLYIRPGYAATLKWLGGLMVVCIFAVSLLYQKDDEFRENFRFGFEGFFSLVETGEWDVKSNETLISMYRFPDNMKTWMIGDGYIDTTDNDPYYIGQRYSGYYMATDVGYLRFIYYGGIFLTLAFILFIGMCAYTCQCYFPKYKTMFWLLFMLQIFVWLKVATDIFCVFAIFIAMGLISNTRQLKEASSVV